MNPESSVKRPVATIGKNSREEIRVTLDEFKGAQLVDIRIFAPFTAANVPMPTKKGVSLRLSALPELIAGLQRAEALAREQGLISAEAA